MLSPRFCCFLLLVSSGISTIISAQTFVFQPTTTLSQESGNNTSAPDSFTMQSNGNAAAGSTSKIPTQSLLYPGSTTKLYAHFMPWFGQPNHMNVGYASNDATQVKKQVDDMMSRGIQGAIIDWYGPSKLVEDQTTQLTKVEAESRSGFKFAVMEDAGALSKCSATAGCDINQQLISDLGYAYNYYEQSPAYLLLNDRPAVFFFGMDAYAIDWNAVRAAVPGNPAFIFRNNGGFTHSQTDGSFSWLNVNTTNPDDEGLAYLDSFYTTALTYPSEFPFGSGYPGFDNSLAPWVGTSAKKMNQHCGQTWLDSLARAGQKYSNSNQLGALQLVTWNDYEEGSELESGIENCVAVNAGMTGASLTWSISGGQENTVHHYATYISLDGSNLMSLGTTQSGPGSYSRDLSILGLDPSKTYTLYVEAVGKPSLKNHFSNAVTFAPANQPPKAAVSVNPSSGTAPLTVTASTASSTDADGSIASSTINFGDGSATVSGTSANHTYNSAGTYTVTATVTDNLGASSQATAKATVSAPVSTCTISKTNRTITICSPAAGGTYKSPVSVVASATDSSAVTYMQIYVDGIKVYQANQVKNISTKVSMKAGTRRVTVQAKDAAGTYWKTVNITAQ